MKLSAAAFLFFVVALSVLCGAESKIYISGAIQGEPRFVSAQEIESISLASNGSLKEVYATAVDKKTKTRFEGVALNDFIGRYGMGGVSRLTIKAWDRYSITIDKNDIKKHSLVLATRENGKHISYKERGPARVVTAKIQSETEQLKDKVQIFAIREIIFIK